MKRSVVLILTAVLPAAACDPAQEVDVLPLPSLEQMSPEARAGLPEIAGTWRFAGWELAEGDSAALERDLPRFGALAIETQRRDSVAGHYVIQAGRAPLYGEVRRDSVLALVGVFGPGDLRFLTGRLARDTVWMEISSLTEPGNWPSDARAAFVRGPVAEPFARLRGALPPPVARVDSLPPLPRTGGAPPAGGAAISTPGTAPGQGTPSPGAGAAPAPRPQTPAPTPRPQTPAPRPQPTPQPPPQPEPEEEEPAEEPPVPLLGEPSQDPSFGSRP